MALAYERWSCLSWRNSLTGMKGKDREVRKVQMLEVVEVEVLREPKGQEEKMMSDEGEIEKEEDLKVEREEAREGKEREREEMMEGRTIGREQMMERKMML